MHTSWALLMGQLLVPAPACSPLLAPPEPAANKLLLLLLFQVSCCQPLLNVPTAAAHLLAIVHL
jgi:hypothetical protein